ncbi:MAG: FadR family transcriptional regulator, partial [Negativicutes bacterium]|nr:FadR family transcriptional regulator [Negativicutes bacterium]
VNSGVSLTQKVIQQLREAISRGDYKPGDKLPSENELAEAFGVSRTSIREAIKVLAGQGLIEVKRGIGAFVIALRPESYRGILSDIQLHKEELLELFQIRRILEEEVAAQAAEKATAEDIRRLDAIIAAAEQTAGDAGMQYEDLNKINAEFHFALLEVTRNRTLKQIMNSLIDTLTESRELTLRLPGRHKVSVAGHREILNAIAARSAERAREAMRRHLRGVEDTIKRMR